MKLRNTKGFTLIEIAIVLTIVGLIIGGIWLAASTVFNNNKAQRLSQDIIQTIQNTKTLFAGQGASASTAGFTSTTIAQEAGIFPADMTTSTLGTIVTPFSVDPTVNAITVTAPTNTTVQYVFGAATPNGLPSGACTQSLTTLGSLNNIQKLGITKLAGTPGADLTGAGTTAVTAAAAAAACSSTGNTNSVTVLFSAI